MKKIYKYIVGVVALLLFCGCNDSEKDLLTSKLYFETKHQVVEVEDVETYELEFVSRLSKSVGSDVYVNYEIGTELMVEEYNKRFGTKHLFMPKENIMIDEKTSHIAKGQIFTAPNILKLKNLNSVEEGKSYLVPLVISNSNSELIDSGRKLFVEIKKPVVINKVYNFNGKYLSVPMPTTANLTSVTYEALIYADSFNWIRTILGVEGILMFRFGDATIDDDMMQIAGNVQFNAPLHFATKKWYHVAFSFDGQSKMGTLYINGEKVSDKMVDVNSFDLVKNFFVGYAYDYDSRRIWGGKMSEVRVWSTARSANQIKQNMLKVDPNSEGLFCYWKLNGTDFYEKDGKYYVKDQSKNGIDAVSRVGRFSNGAGTSIKPEVVDLKVKLK